MMEARLVLLVCVAGFGADPNAPIVFNDDGGWCWFQDERAIIREGKLIIGTVAAGRNDPSRRGDIEVTVYDLASGARNRVELHDRFQLDDHDSPAFLARPDGRILVLYAKHGPEDRFYYRISEPGDATRWGPVRTYAPSTSTRLTYSNLFLLTAEKDRIYDFFRGLNGKSKPSYAYSDDLGETWKTGGIVIQSPAARPYVRYASNGVDTIHLVYTEGHPRDFDNSVYHIFYRTGMLHRSDGSPIRRIEEGLRAPDEGTRFFQGDPDHVAWTTDVELDKEGRPYVVYTVQVGSAKLPSRQGGNDHRFRYARWDGKAWRDVQLAYAGTRLYAGEDDYTGLAALVPGDPDTVYISTDADPRDGTALKSGADGERHREIFRGTTADGGSTWTWTAVTKDSTADNLRPIVTKGEKGRSALLWLRGRLRAYTDYDLEVVGIILGQSGPTPSAKAVDTKASGTYVSGPWAYDYRISAIGTRSERRAGILSYGGKVLDADFARPLDRIRTPWGMMQFRRSQYDQGWLLKLTYDRPIEMDKGRLLQPPKG